MGCDIHPRVQVREPYMGWKSVAVPSDGRWYAFFELLNGVRARNEFDGVMPNLRGLPDVLGYDDDYNPESREKFGDHSQTWWTLAEMKAALPAAEKFCAGDVEWRGGALERFKEWIALGELMGKAHEAETDDDVRYVVGYDN